MEKKLWVESNGPKIINITSVTVTIYAWCWVKIDRVYYYLPKLPIYKVIGGPGTIPDQFDDLWMFKTLLGVVKVPYEGSVDAEIGEDAYRLIIEGNYKTPKGRLKKKVAEEIRRILIGDTDTIVVDGSWRN